MNFFRTSFDYVINLFREKTGALARYLSEGRWFGLGRKHVFISFKTEEREEARKIKDALISAGINTWWSEDIQCGQEWHGEIDKALESAGAVVVLWSEMSIRSKWVSHEASQAVACRTYVPIRIRLVDIPTPYDRLQAIDLIGWNVGDTQNPKFRGLVKKINELMPSPQRRFAAYFQRNIVAIVVSIILVAALWLLWTLNSDAKKQSARQAEMMDALTNQNNALDSQLTTQNTLLSGVNVLDSSLRVQLNQQERLTSSLKQLQQQQEEDLKRTLGLGELDFKVMEEHGRNITEIRIENKSRYPIYNFNMVVHECNAEGPKMFTPKTIAKINPNGQIREIYRHPVNRDTMYADINITTSNKNYCISILYRRNNAHFEIGYIVYEGVQSVDCYIHGASKGKRVFSSITKGLKDVYRRGGYINVNDDWVLGDIEPKTRLWE